MIIIILTVLIISSSQVPIELALLLKFIVIDAGLSALILSSLTGSATTYNHQGLI